MELILEDNTPLSGKMPISDVLAILNKTQGVSVDEDDLETNGWQVDYWQSFMYMDEKYTLSGSMYYGTYEITKN